MYRVLSGVWGSWGFHSQGRFTLIWPEEAGCSVNQHCDVRYIYLFARRNVTGYWRLSMASVAAQQRRCTGAAKQSGTDAVEPALALTAAQVAGGTVGAEAVGQLA